MLTVEAAGITDVGRKRKANEDTYLIQEDYGLFIVADGMGGHQAGEVASDLVVKTMHDYIERFRKNGDVEELVKSDSSLSSQANYLNSSIHLANRVVYQFSQSKDSYRGMGSTVSTILVTDDTLIAANVGDSPIYLVRNGTITTLSMPHTVIAEQMALNPEGVSQLGKNYRHMLTRAMGIDRNVEPYICEIQSYKDDTIVIASDGLSDKVTPEEVLDVVCRNRPEKTCQILVDLANERGGDDNITIIVLKTKSLNHQRSGIMGLISRLFKIR